MDAEKFIAAKNNLENLKNVFSKFLNVACRIKVSVVNGKHTKMCSIHVMSYNILIKAINFFYYWKGARLKFFGT